MWSACITIYHTNSYCLHDRYVSPHSAHVSVLIVPCGHRVSRHIALIRTIHITTMSRCGLPPCGHRVSRHIALIRIIHVVRVDHHIVPMWSECIATYCIDSYGSYGQHVSVYCIDSYGSHGQHVSVYCPCGQSVSPYIALIHTVHMVTMYHDIFYQFILFT